MISVLSRRQFLQQSSALAASAAVKGFALPDKAAASVPEHAGVLRQTLRLEWQYMRFSLAGPWQAWSTQPLDAWTDVSVPHCFNSYDGCDPDTPAYRGKGWYRRHLKLANPYTKGRTLLHCEGAGQSSEFFIGESSVGRHVGGYDEFVMDITEAATRADATDSFGTRLSVLCDNSPDLDRMPSDLSDFTLYGGLYRDLHLVYVPQVSLEAVHVHVQAAAAKPAQIRLEARLYNPTHTNARANVTVTVIAPDGHEVYNNTAARPVWEGSAELAFLSVHSPKLWSPKTPTLYQCTVRVSVDGDESVHVDRFGIRFFEFQEHGPFLLNGERLLIQGTHRHEDHAGYAAAMPTDLIREEMVMIRAMGANFIRLAHYQQQRLVLDLCDELGMLVWEELSWCRAGVGSKTFQEYGKQKLNVMIDQHRNHPSIILWSLGNEDDWEGEYPSVDKTAIPAYMEELNVLAHRLDDTRLTTYRRCDFARNVPDVYSPSIWAGWYGGRFVDYQAALEEQRPRVARMLHTEWGADCQARRHAEDPYKLLHSVKAGDTAERGMAYMLQGGTPRVSRDGDWSETYACDLYDWHLKVQQSLPWLAGAVHWIFKDFTTPLRVGNPVPRINQKGVVERDMTKKEGFYVFQSYWSETPMVHVYGHSWPVRWGKPGEPRTVRVYSNCPTAELFVNGKSAGVHKRDIQDFPAAGLHWDVPFEGGRNTVYAIATTADGRKLRDEVSFDYQTEMWSCPAKLTLNVVERSGANVTVEALLLDAKSVLCLDARNWIRFSAAGDATLLDNLGTSFGSRYVQLCNGRSRITLRQGKGDAVASVTSDEITPAFCSLPVKAKGEEA